MDDNVKSPISNGWIAANSFDQEGCYRRRESDSQGYVYGITLAAGRR
jgi:hypothetical protein